MVASNTIFYVLLHSSFHWIFPMRFGVVLHIWKIKELFVSLKLQHQPTTLHGVEQGGKLYKLPTFSPTTSLTTNCNIDPITLGGINNFIFVMFIIHAPFFHPIQAFSIFLQFMYFWNESQLNVNSLFLCSISKQTLYLTMCTCPSNPICNASQGNLLPMKLKIFK
jgi:hypothetical protein